MGAKIALCVDQTTYSNPESIGLDGENLQAQEWLRVHVGGQEARDALAEDEVVQEIWVTSCDDVEPINLAATLKSDCEERTVRLLSATCEDSLLVRARRASIDEVMNRSSFAERYRREKGLAILATSKGENEELAGETREAGGSGEERGAAGADGSPNEGVPAKPSIFHAKGWFQHAGRPATETGPQPDAEPCTATSTALAIVAPAPAAQQGRGFLLPVVSGSGGAGKSTVSLLSARCAHALGFKTLLLDYDLQFGDVAPMAGIENPLTIDEALAQPDKLEQEAARDDRFALLAPPAHLEMSESVVRALPELVARMAPLFDVIVANTGAAWAEQHAALLERSSAALFLIDQRSSSIRACRHALELCARCGIATGQFQFVLNRCGKNAPLTSMDVSCALQGASVAELRDGGRDVEEYLAAGALDELVESGNELHASVARLVADVLPDADAHAKGPAGATRLPLSGKRKGRHAGRRKGWGR